MKRFTTLLLLALAITLPAHAQLRFGLRGGIAVNKMHLNNDVFNSDNRAGFTGGVTVDLGLPIVGLGLDASLLYTHRNNDLTDGQSKPLKRDYIEIPVHLRYKFNLALVSSIIAPYAFTGPSFSFLCHEDSPDGYENSSTYTSWDIGAGVEFFKHLQISASYGLGLSNALKQVGVSHDSRQVHGKDRYWTLTAAYLF